MKDDIEKVVSHAIEARVARERDYRTMSLKMHPWICARCAREFNEDTLHELTVHHKDHNHENNPDDGSNWENLCVYCHDNEHSRHIENQTHSPITTPPASKVVTHKALAGLGEVLANSERSRQE